MNIQALRECQIILETLDSTEDGPVRWGLAEELLRHLREIDLIRDLVPEDMQKFAGIRHFLEILSDDRLADPTSWADLPAIINRALSQPIAPQHSRFPKVAEEQYRNLLDRDLLDMEACIANGLWKPAMVLSGSILEAALYEFLRRNPSWTMDQKRNPPKNYKGTAKDILKDDRENQWTLEELIDYVSKNELLGKPDVWKETLHNFIRKYRNLVHPTRELRAAANEAVCREAAEHCRATLIAVLKALSEKPTPP